MSTSKEPRKKGTKLKILHKRDPHDLLLSSPVIKEQKERYFLLKSHMILSTQFFYWECMRELGYEDELRELLDKIQLKEIVEIHKETLLDILFCSW